MDTANPLDRLARRLGESLCWLFAVAVVLTAFEVVMRYVANSPTIWVHDTVILLTAICFVAGGSYALERRSHIQITSVYGTLSPRTRGMLDVLIALAAAFFLGALAYGAALQSVEALGLTGGRLETSGRAWDVPIPAVLKTVLALGVILMTAQSLLHAVQAWRKWTSSP